MLGKLFCRKGTFRSALLMGAAFLAALVTDSTPVLAGDAFGGFVGGFVGGVVGGIIGGSVRPRYYYGQNPQGNRHNQSNPKSNSNSPTSDESSNALAALAPPTSSEQTAVLKSIVPLAALASVGSSDDLERMSKYANEQDRDYTADVEKLKNDLARKPDDKKTATQTVATSDITQHAIMEALDDAIRNTELIKFETFRDESWSPERLRVMIIDRLRIDLGDVLDGSKSESLTMHDLETSIGKAARAVQARLFETSELLAANRDSTLFLLRLYQAHGDVSGDVREHIEQLLAKAATDGVAPYEALFQRDPNGYALHYRSERIVYDCLTDNVEAISSGESGVATEAEIEKRILDLNKDQCSAWVANQIVSKQGMLKPQEPMPLRVIWSAEGPRTDPSMFNRAPDEL